VIDFKCGFNKDYLMKGDLSNPKLSQVFFKDGDAIEGDLHFGCGLYLSEGDPDANEFEALLSLIQ